MIQIFLCATVPECLSRHQHIAGGGGALASTKKTFCRLLKSFNGAKQFRIFFISPHHPDAADIPTPPPFIVATNKPLAITTLNVSRHTTRRTTHKSRWRRPKVYNVVEPSRKAYGPGKNRQATVKKMILPVGFCYIAVVIGIVLHVRVHRSQM